MKPVLLLLALACLLVVPVATAGPKECHGHNPACTTTDAGATIVVTRTSTTWTAWGCPGSSDVRFDVQYETDGNDGFGAGGTGTTDPDGTIESTFRYIGADTVEAVTGERYTGAGVTVTCGDLVLTAHT